MSIRKQCQALNISRSRIYHKPKAEKAENLEVMHLMDEHNIEHPDEGVQGMRNMLINNSIVVNHKRIRRLMKLHPAADGHELHHGVRDYIHYYNYLRGHSAVGDRPPYLTYGVPKAVIGESSKQALKYPKQTAQREILQTIKKNLLT